MSWSVHSARDLRKLPEADGSERIRNSSSRGAGAHEPATSRGVAASSEKQGDSHRTRFGGPRSHTPPPGERRHHHDQRRRPLAPPPPAAQLPRRPPEAAAPGPQVYRRSGAPSVPPLPESLRRRRRLAVSGSSALHSRRAGRRWAAARRRESHTRPCSNPAGTVGPPAGRDSDGIQAREAGRARTASRGGDGRPPTCRMWLAITDTRSRSRSRSRSR